MNPMDNSRKSERRTKGIPPERYGFSSEDEDIVSGGGDINHTLTTIRSMHTINAADNRSMASSKRSVQSAREIQYLKTKMQRDAEIHRMEMEELKEKYEYERKCREREKQHLLKIQGDEQLIKELENDLENSVDENDNIDDLRKKSTNEWVRNVPFPLRPVKISQSWHGDFKSIPHEQPIQMVKENHVKKQPRPTYDDRMHGSRNRNGSLRDNQVRNDEIQESNIPRKNEDFHGNTISENTHHDVLAAAFKALQSREVKDLPIFNGNNVLEWPNFISEFRRSTNEFQISDNKNLRRLNKALQGDARTSVESLLTSPDNIDKIILHLESNFGRPEWILQHLLNDLRSLPNMKEENINQFKTFYNKLFGAITTIRNMEHEHYLENPDLLACMEDKLPYTTRNYWIHHKANLKRNQVRVNIVEFGEWFEYELDAQYAGLSVKDIVKKSNKATVLNINSSNPSKVAKEKWCYKCSSNIGHYLQDCAEFKKMTVEERREFVKNNNICFMCLIKGHQTRACKKRAKLPMCSKCNKGHSDLLHLENVPVEEVRCINTSDVLLKIAKVTLKGKNNSKTIFAFFDDGTVSLTTTLIDEDLANELGLEGTVSLITYRWTNDVIRTDNQSRIVEVGISASHQNAKFYPLMNVRTAKNLSLPRQKLDVNEIMKLHPYIYKPKLEAIKDTQPLLLIGSNNANLTVSLQTRQLKSQGLLECKSLLGWTVHGSVYNKSIDPQTSLSLYLCTESEKNIDLNELIKESYKIENFGVRNEAEKMSEADAAAITIMRNTMRKVDDRFEIGHLYKYPEMQFPTNQSKQIATKRLLLIERKMDRNPQFAKEYIQKIENYVKKGYAQKLSGDELKETPRTFYLPHFDAYHPHKPGFRWVMDAKAKAGNYSLNDLLYQGPDFVPPLLAVLWRLRMKPIGFSSDIKEMFHQVLIRPEDKDSQRFLFRGMNRKDPPDVYRMNAMMFGAVSSPSTAQFVKNENPKLLENEYPGVERAIIKQHYVDDYVDSTNTVEEAVKLATNVMTVHQKGGFQLVKWISNSTEFMKHIPEEMRSPNYDQIDEVRLLGILWNIKNDELVFKFQFQKFDPEFLNGEVIPTKREMLKFLMTIYDPLGILSPIVIKLKIIFQELWRLDIKWDCKVPEGVYEKWLSWLKEVKVIEQVQIPRCYFPFLPQYDNVQLHTLSDAGEKAYNAMTFIRIECNNQAYLSLIQAKSRVAPMKQLTIPRLELQAAVTGSQIAQTIGKELGVTIKKKYFWVDSTIVLSWINTKERLEPYVGSRISRILSSSEKQEWLWIPIHLNVADLATKNMGKVEKFTSRRSLPSSIMRKFPFYLNYL